MRIQYPAIAVALWLCVVAGCTKSGVNEELVRDIPRYPNAEETESMGKSFLGGMMSANLVQYTTADPYDEVIAFYSESLAAYETDVSTHTSELGRQSAIDVERDRGQLTIAVQEFRDERKVNITLMWGR